MFSIIFIFRNHCNDEFSKAFRDNGKTFLSAYGHTHDQTCTDKANGCRCFLSGGGGGWINDAGPYGFGAVHLNDDKGWSVIYDNTHSASAHVVMEKSVCIQV